MTEITREQYEQDMKEVGIWLGASLIQIMSAEYNSGLESIERVQEIVKKIQGG